MEFIVENLCKFELELDDNVAAPNDVTSFFIRNLPLLEAEKNNKVLDFGTGTGILSLYLASRGYKDIVAVDESNIALDFAQRNVKRYKFQEVIDVRSLDILSNIRKDEKFTLIVTNPGGMIIGNNRTNSSILYLLKGIGNIMDNGRVVFILPTLANINETKELFREKGFDIKTLAKSAFKLDIGKNKTDDGKSILNFFGYEDNWCNENIIKVDGHLALVYEMIEAVRK